MASPFVFSDMKCPVPSAETQRSFRGRRGRGRGSGRRRGQAPGSPDSLQFPTERRLSRKDHAIGRLTRRIMEQLPDTVDCEADSWEIGVDDVIGQFGCSKGSAYEVFHVLEALMLATKIGRNQYRWNGFGKLEVTLAFLKRIGICLNLRAEIDRVRNQEVNELIEMSQDKDKTYVGKTEPSSPFEFVSTSEEFGESSSQELFCEDEIKVKNEPMTEEKSMQILTICHKFIMLFLVMEKVLSLEFASKVIQGNVNLPDADFRSRTRRLYDVTNILMSLKFPLIRKVRVLHFLHGSRTSFQYRGPDVDHIHLTETAVLNLPDYRRKYLFFQPGKQILGIPERPVRIPNVVTVRLQEENEGEYKLVEGFSTGLQMDKVAYADICAPLDLNAIVDLEKQNMVSCLRKSKDKKLGMVTDNKLESRFVSVAQGNAVSMVRMSFRLYNVSE